MRKNLMVLSLLVPFISATNFDLALSQTSQQIPIASKPESSTSLLQDTPVKLRIAQTISSATSKLNDTVNFEVVEDIKVGNSVVVPQNSVAIGTVTEARTKKSFGRAGKLNVNIDYVRLANGEKVPLKAVKGGSGGSHTGAMTGAVVATAIVFFPAAPLFFFIKGKNIVIPKGTEITAFVAADTPLSAGLFKEVAVPTSVRSESPSLTRETSELSALLVKSTPDASDITVDGRFVGSTTSTLRLTTGDHTLLIEKAGFRPWQRTISVTNNGNVTVDATLERIP